MAKRHQKQAEEIREILERTGLEAAELARKVLIKPETMRKIVNGYQPASDRLMELIRVVAREEISKKPMISEREAQYRTELQKKVALIERNATDAERDVLDAVVDKIYRRDLARLREETKK